MYERAFREGITFQEFLAGAAVNRDLWQGVAARVRLAQDVVERARALPGDWRLLAIADDWCGDAVNILPVVGRLAEEVDGLSLRIVSRESFPEVMDRHLTRGSRSIPVVILLDDAGHCRGWWGPRPSELQAWFEAVGRPLPKEERYREIRRWYARDRGAAIAREIVDLVVCATSPAAEICHDVRHPCPDQVAA